MVRIAGILIMRRTKITSIMSMVIMKTVMKMMIMVIRVATKQWSE